MALRGNVGSLGMFSGSGGGGATSGLGGGTSGQYGPLSGQTYYANPELAQQLLSALSGAPGQAAGQFNKFIKDPTASPLFQNQLQGLLQALEPSERQAQTQLSDQFRGAGNMASTAYGSAGAQLQGDILGRRQQVAGDLLGKSFSQITQALLGAMQQGPQLLEAMRLSQQYRAPQNQTVAGGGTSSSPSSTGLSSTGARAPAIGGGGTSSGSYTPGSGGGYSPLNPGSTPYEQAYYSQYGYLPGQSGNPFIDNPNYQDPYANQGSTIFMPGGQMVGGSSPGNNAIYDQARQEFPIGGGGQAPVYGNPDPISQMLEGDDYTYTPEGGEY